MGRGRRRRFPEAALAVFTKLRAESKRGPKAKAPTATRSKAGAGIDRALARRIRRLEAMQATLGRQLDEVVRLLRRPLRVVLRELRLRGE